MRLEINAWRRILEKVRNIQWIYSISWFVALLRSWVGLHDPCAAGGQWCGHRRVTNRSWDSKADRILVARLPLKNVRQSWVLRFWMKLLIFTSYWIQIIKNMLQYQMFIIMFSWSQNEPVIDNAKSIPSTIWCDSSLLRQFLSVELKFKQSSELST